MTRGPSLARKRYRVSFKPLKPDAKTFLSWMTGLDFSGQDFTDEDYWFCCTVYDKGAPVIVIVLEFKSPHDPHLTVAVTDPHGLSRSLLTTLFQTTFVYAERMTALVEPGNKRVIDQIWRMGFKYEGYLRRGYGDRRDALVFGLLPEDCPYMLGRPFVVRTVTATHEAVQRMQ